MRVRFANFFYDIEQSETKENNVITTTYEHLVCGVFNAHNDVMQIKSMDTYHQYYYAYHQHSTDDNPRK